MAESRVRSTAAQLFAEEEEEAAAEAAKSNATIPVYDRVRFLLCIFFSFRNGVTFFLYDFSREVTTCTSLRNK